MNSTAAPVTKDLVLLGGGHAHVEVLRSLGMDPLPGLRITLVSPHPTTPYSGMIPGYIAGRYSLDTAHIDLRRLCHFAQAQFYLDKACQIDPDAKQILFASRPPVGFDLLSIDIGSTPSLEGIKGARDHALPVKPIDRFLAGWEQALEERNHKKPFRVAVVGAGAGGVELTLSLQHRLKSGASPEVRFHLITQTPTVLPTHNHRVQAIFHRILKERGIHLHLEQTVSQVSATQIQCQNGDTIDADLVIWATHASAPPWITQSKLDTDPRGFIAVNDRLQSTSHPFIFAAGDIAAVVHHPRPKSGVFAVRQGPPLTRNLRLAFSDQPLVPFTPQESFLSLISTGNEYAVASRGSIAMEGSRVWKLKDWIDRRWMRTYRDLPGLPPPSHPSPETPPQPPLPNPDSIMRCGGCGAKVGRHILTRVLSRISPVHRKDVKIGLSSPDDAAVTVIAKDHVSVQTVDFFRSFISDPYLFGRIAANHSLGDIFAMGAEPQSALAIATVPYGAPERIEEHLFQLLCGANEILAQCNTALTGGHTAEGPELAFGLAVQGIAKPSRLLRKDGIRPGDKLILTKPLGTGTLLAADMRLQAEAEWIQQALVFMQQSSRQAAECLLSHKATACTDVTGFGLLGHLHEMLQASAVAATLFMNAIPVMPGALQTINMGIVSTLQPENLRLRHNISNPDDVVNDTLFQLLFDPQTAGGLLASVPAARADRCLKQLHNLGYPHASIIAQASPRTDPAIPITLTMA